jgi:hypothetical protein
MPSTDSSGAAPATATGVGAGAGDGGHRHHAHSAPRLECCTRGLLRRSSGSCAHTGDPDRVKQNMVRFGYVLRMFGITLKGLGITAHGLRHKALIEEYNAITGQEPPPGVVGKG